MPDADLCEYRLFENEIPDFLPEFLRRKYASAYCVFERFFIYANRDTSAYHSVVFYKQSVPIHALVFLRKGSTIEVMNKLAPIEGEYVERFAAIVFKTYPDVRVIDVSSCPVALKSCRFPLLNYRLSNDVVLELPHSEEEYRKMLGSATRKNIVKYSNRVLRQYSDFSCDVLDASAVSDAAIHDVLEMNRSRMHSKGTVSGIDDDYEAQICEFARTYGFIVRVCMDGKLVAGTISSLVCGHVFVHVVGHDNKYNAYHVGELAYYKTIVLSIERGQKVVHMLWGKSEYKFRLAGADTDLYSYFIFSRRIDWLRAFLLLHMNRRFQRWHGHYTRFTRRFAGFSSRYLGSVSGLQNLARRSIMYIGSRTGLIDFSSEALDQVGLSSERSSKYDPSGGGGIELIFEVLGVTSKDAILDLGCGKGRAIVSMAKFQFSRIGGVEISERLVAIARRNLYLLFIRHIDLICTDAADFKAFEGYNYVYMFNPFPAVVMSSVLENIQASLSRDPRIFRIIYNNPVCHEVIVGKGFVKVRSFDHCAHEVSVYQN